MFHSLRMRHLDLVDFKENRMLFRIWGIVLVILGTIAISAYAAATYITVVFLGSLILASGIVILFDTFSFWRRSKWSGFFLNLIIAILYIVAGASLLIDPLMGSVSLTLLLGIVYISLGLVRISYSVLIRPPLWGWNFLNGIFSIALGILILINWPESSIYIIGLLIGIDLLFTGWAYIMSSLDTNPAI